MHTIGFTPAFTPLLSVVERTLRESADPDVARDFDAAGCLEYHLTSHPKGK